MHETRKVAVLGAGSYGTCLAKHLGDKGHDVLLWCRSAELAETLRSSRENPTYLPGFSLPETVRISSVLSEAASGRDIVVGVTPSHAARGIMEQLSGELSSETVVVNASKGLEEGTLDRMDEIYGEVLPAAIAERAVYLSGPTFAKEVAASLPSAIVVAGRTEETVSIAQRAFSTERFRAYSSSDVIGVQIGGALKNVIAIAAGVSDGLGFGHNARAALITRGLAEITRIGVKLGANPLTFAGLSGMGDLVLTCAGDLSRNRRVGLAIAAGKSLAEVTGEMQMVAEGVKTTKAAVELADSHGVDAPIARSVYGILYGGKAPLESIRELMTRRLKSELE